MDNDIDILYQKIEELGNDLRDAFQRIKALEHPAHTPSCDSGALSNIASLRAIGDEGNTVDESTDAPKQLSLVEAVEAYMNKYRPSWCVDLPSLWHAPETIAIRAALSAQKAKDEERKAKDEAVGELVELLNSDGWKRVLRLAAAADGGNHIFLSRDYAASILAAIERLGGGK